MASSQDIQFVKHKPQSHRRHYVDENDVRTVLNRLPDRLLARLKKIHFNDRAKGNRVLGYTTTRGRRDISICALPNRLSLSRAPGAKRPEEYGAIKGSQWPTTAIRRYMLYDVLLHEIGHLQVIQPKQKNPRRKFADERIAEEFAEHWRKRLWAEPFDHPDPVHNAPGEEELEELNKGWAKSHLHYKTGIKFEKQGDLGRAEDEYKMATLIYRNHAQALERFGIMKYARTGVEDPFMHSEIVATILRRALEIDPTLFDATLYLAITLDSIDQQEESRKIFKRAIALGPYSHIAKTVYAEHLGCWGEYVAAESLFKKVLKKNPNCGLALRDYANMLMSRDENIDKATLEKAIELLEKALRNGMPHVCHYLLGKAHSSLDNSIEAIRHFNEVIKLRPNYKDTVKLLAELETNSEAE